MNTPNRPQGQYNTSLPVLAREVIFIRENRAALYILTGILVAAGLYILKWI
nr:MAG TPA: hypothetical protein [Caudoviricetes sp.]